MRGWAGRSEICSSDCVHRLPADRLNSSKEGRALVRMEREGWIRHHLGQVTSLTGPVSSAIEPCVRAIYPCVHSLWGPGSTAGNKMDRIPALKPFVFRGLTAEVITAVWDSTRGCRGRGTQGRSRRRHGPNTSERQWELVRQMADDWASSVWSERVWRRQRREDLQPGMPSK